MAEELEREAKDTDFVAKAFGGPGQPLRACAGANGKPCPTNKTVVRSDRCPDCTLAHGRNRAQARMAKATAADDVDEETDPDVEHLDRELHDGLVEGDETDVVVTAQPRRNKPERAFRGGGFKPGTRQPAPKASTADTPRNWWETAKQGEMTKTAEHEQPRMSGSKQAKRVTGSIND